MKECCLTCRYHNKLVRYDYTNVADNGVIHRDMGGFACTAFANTDEQYVIHMVGTMPEKGMCECYSKIGDG